MTEALWYIERAPDAAIAPWVLSFWSFQSDEVPADLPPYTVWPDGCTSICVIRAPEIRDALGIVGPRYTGHSRSVSSHWRVWGFRLWPDTTATLTGISPRALRDLIGPPPDAIQRRFSTLASSLPQSDDADVIFPAMARWLARALADAPAPDPRIRAAVRAIVAAKGEVKMSDVARESALSVRQLQRLFPDATGLTLREYARVRRLREALAHRIAAQPPGWSRIAAETGYTDHAHLTREFVALLGFAPSAAARQLMRTGHQDVVP
ncbi:MAG: helix-turn-helix domain-containing protein [Gemmatimonadaceae bacterium]